ncbi:MAG: hypothetical protein OHK0017_10430 [Patescibacteria group bacterium]
MTSFSEIKQQPEYIKPAVEVRVDFKSGSKPDIKFNQQIQDEIWQAEFNNRSIDFKSNFTDYINYALSPDLSTKERLIMLKFINGFKFLDQVGFHELLSKTSKLILAKLRAKNIHQVDLYLKNGIGLSSYFLSKQLKVYLEQNEIQVDWFMAKQTNPSISTAILSIDDGTYSGSQDALYISNIPAGKENIGQFFLTGTNKAETKLNKFSNEVFIQSYIPTLGEIFSLEDLAIIYSITAGYVFEDEYEVNQNDPNVEILSRCISFFNCYRIPDSNPNILMGGVKPILNKTFKLYKDLKNEYNELRKKLTYR